jgi:arabinofuranosyltransferase
MPNINRRNYIFITIAYLLVSLSYLLSEYIITGHHFGVPLDDTWIHFRFAENFSHGHFFEYNINQPTPGTTSPLWVMLLSISFLLKLDPIVFSISLSSLFFLLTCLETYRLSSKLGFTPNFALMAALLVVFAGRLAWSSLSGMEITVFCYLTLLAANLYLDELKENRVTVLTGLVLGLAVVIRPEGILLALIYFILSFPTAKPQAWRKRESGSRRSLACEFISIGIFLLIALPYPIFSYIHTDSFLPNTFKGQGGEFRFIPDIVFLGETGKLFFKDNLIILILWFLAIGTFIKSFFVTRNGVSSGETPFRRPSVERNYLLINLWVILLPVVSSVLTPNWRHHGRYLIPLIPFIIVTGLHVIAASFSSWFGFSSQTGSLPPSRKKGLIRNGFVALMFLLTLVSTVIYGRALGWNVENINDQQVKVAVWVNHNLPEEKVLGMNDIGAIGYITKKKVVDMAGLINPEVFQFEKMPEPEGNKSLLKLLRDNRVNYIIIYPNWYRYLTTHYADALERIYSARLAYNTICGGDEAVVYKIKWDLILF